MILPAQTIRALCQDFLRPMVFPFSERAISHGRSYGLGPASYDVRLKQSMWLWPLWGRLASTIEEFDIPTDVLAEVKDKSSNARVFVTVQNTLIDPGFRGGLTLELTRHLPWPKYLRAGTPIAQIKFSRLEAPTELAYRGKYYGQSTDPEPVRYERGAPMPDKRPHGHEAQKHDPHRHVPRPDPHHGEMKPIRYPDHPAKRLGNWLYRLVTGRL